MVMKKSVKKLIKKMSERYNKNKDEKIKMVCICPSCGSKFTKNTKAQVFCRTQSGSKCRDKYWNTVDPTKRNNRTRISPQREIFLQKVVDDDHPFSSDGLGQW